MTNLTLSDFYNPMIISITKVFMDLAFLLQFFMAPFICYAIIKNTRMNIYRWYLINEIAWNWVLGFCYAFISSSLFGVYPILLVNSFFEYCFGINSWYTFMEICLYAMVNTIAGLSISIAYRVIHLLNLTQFISVAEKPAFLISVIGIIQAVAFGSTYLIFETRRSSVLSQENYEFLAKEAPFLEEIFIQRRVIAFGAKDADISVAIIAIFLMTLIYIAASIIFTIFPIIFLQRSKKERSQQTYELQLKLYKACLIQIWIIIILCICPACFILFIYWREIPNSAIIVQIFWILPCWHGPVDLFVIGYFIPSHRKFFVQLLHRALKRIMNGNNVTTIPSHTAWGTQNSHI